jgi:hypothetical protein
MQQFNATIQNQLNEISGQLSSSIADVTASTTQHASMIDTLQNSQKALEDNIHSVAVNLRSELTALSDSVKSVIVAFHCF